MTMRSDVRRPTSASKPAVGAELTRSTKSAPSISEPSAAPSSVAELPTTAHRRWPGGAARIFAWKRPWPPRQVAQYCLRAIADCHASTSLRFLAKSGEVGADGSRWKKAGGRERQEAAVVRVGVHSIFKSCC